MFYHHSITKVEYLQENQYFRFLGKDKVYKVEYKSQFKVTYRDIISKNLFDIWSYENSNWKEVEILTLNKYH